jgi:Asp-tRNA(Asn)/Glu-tRNA(Gln) amidotransferase A subunit family amidase
LTVPSPSSELEALRLGLKLGDVDVVGHLTGMEESFTASNREVMAFLRERKRFRRVRREAKAMNRRYGKASERPLLYGMPFGAKDIFRAAGFKTKAGSKLPPRVLQGKEAASVSQLREAGAILMGKTVTTEFAYFAPGPTRNPHNVDHTPGGSSSGSAAAVAARMVPLALGTQTIGSVIRPASFCGTVGFKPSYDRISREGVVPLAPSLDHVGLFTPDVVTAQLAAAVLCADWRGNATATKRPSIAIPVGNFLSHAGPEMQAHFQTVVDKLKEAGFRVKRYDPIANYEEVVERHHLILAAEAAEVHKDWYRLYNELYHPRTAELIEEGKAIKAETLKAAHKEARYFRESIHTMMDLHGIDVWMAPSAAGFAPYGLDSTGDPVMNLPWTQAGLPVLGLPTGRAENGLPLGTQFIANFNSDEELLAWGLEIEQVLGKTE